jgi:hypothetical protein
VATVAVPQQDAGTRLTLTATGFSPQAASPAAARASVTVKRLPKPTPAPALGTPAPGGAGVTIPPPAWPPATLAPATLPAGVPLSASLPPLPDPIASPGVVLPAFTPQPTTARPARPLRVTDVSAQFPPGTHAIGGQIAGLAALAAATIIAIARLSLRKKRPQQGKDGGATSEPFSS